MLFNVSGIFLDKASKYLANWINVKAIVIIQMFIFSIYIKQEDKVLKPDYLPKSLSKLHTDFADTVCYLVDLAIKIIMASSLMFELNNRNIQVYK